MILRCNKCSTPFRADDVNLNAGLARCRVCDVVNSISAIPECKPRPTIPAPSYVDVRDTGKLLEISWPVNNNSPGQKVVASAFIGFYMLLFGGIGSAVLLMAPGPLSFLGTIPLLIGCGLLYVLMGTFANRYVIQLTPEALTIDLVPMGVGNQRREWEPANIAQLFCTQVHGGCQVMCMMKDGTTVQVVTIRDSNAALFLEQKIESHLGIEDRPVTSELPRLLA